MLGHKHTVILLSRASMVKCLKSCLSVHLAYTMLCMDSEHLV